MKEKVTTYEKKMRAHYAKLEKEAAVMLTTYRVLSFGVTCPDKQTADLCLESRELAYKKLLDILEKFKDIPEIT